MIEKMINKIITKIIIIILILGNRGRVVGELIVATGWGDLGDQPTSIIGGETYKLVYTSIHKAHPVQSHVTRRPDGHYIGPGASFSAVHNVYIVQFFFLSTERAGTYRPTSSLSCY